MSTVMSQEMSHNEPVVKTVSTIGAGYSIVGRVWADGEAEWFPLSAQTTTAAIPAAVEYLRSLGLEAGQVVCFVSRFQEAVQFAALERAALAMGLIACHVEATAFDANRLAVYLEHLPVAAVIGLGTDVLDNLEVEFGSLLSTEAVVIAWESVLERLRDNGFHPLRMAFAGPAIAIECQEHAGLHLDTSVWAYRIGADGRLAVSLAGAVGSAPVRTDLSGELVAEPCACGRTGLRLVAADDEEGEGDR